MERNNKTFIMMIILKKKKDQDPKDQTSTPKTSNFSPSSLKGSFPNVGQELLIPFSNDASSQSPYRPFLSPS